MDIWCSGVDGNFEKAPLIFVFVPFEVLLEVWLVVPVVLVQKRHEDQDSAIVIGAFEEQPCESCELPLGDPDEFPHLLLQFLVVKVVNLDPLGGVEVYEVEDAEILLWVSQLLLNSPKRREFQVQELRLIIHSKKILVSE